MGPELIITVGPDQSSVPNRYNAAHPNQPIETVLAEEDSFMDALRQSTPTDTGARLDQAEEALRGLRNTIFHVPHGQADMFDADTRLAHAPISHGHYLDLVAGLTYFYQGIDPATLSEFE